MDAVKAALEGEAAEGVWTMEGVGVGETSTLLRSLRRSGESTRCQERRKALIGGGKSGGESKRGGDVQM